MHMNKNQITVVTVIGALLILVSLFLGTIWLGNAASRDTENAVRSVSLLYLDELAGRREQVVSNNLQDRIGDMQAALGMISADDLQDKSHLESYQTKMKQLFKLERFAFVDTTGLIYTSTGMQADIDTYPFDYKSLLEPGIFIKDLESPEKKVIIAMPVQIPFQDKQLIVSFMQIDMQEMLSGVSMQSQDNSTTFCNIYTDTGIALSNTVLGGLAVEDNLLEAMRNASFESGYSYEQLCDDFHNAARGKVCFTYNGIAETLAYAPISGTNWQLTYLIRESVISEQISSVSRGIIIRSVIQSILTLLILLSLFTYIVVQGRKNAQLQLEKETSDAESRVKQEELEHRLELQEKLISEKKAREQHEHLINALASDYWSVYYLELDKDHGICYQQHADVDDGLKTGEHFNYLETVTAYANHYITEQYRDVFLQFVQPESIQRGLQETHVISYVYTVFRHGKESYEMVRFARVGNPDDANDQLIHTVGACFTDVDLETRKNLMQQQALSDALAEAEQASKAKTAFLSNMSHEIRTPMNAIIGLDNIALNDPEATPHIKECLEKIGTSAEHLLSLINDILDMSRIEAGRMALKHEEFSFSKLLEAINTMFSAQCQDKGLSYTCQVHSDISDYYIGDSMKLRQILINILGNAVKFTDKGGSVSLSIERKMQFENKSVLSFTISDTGIGMNPEFIPRVFDPFAQEDSSSTSRYGSSGLGLAITKNLIEMMNGTIEVNSTKGVGSTFIVTVTLDNADKACADVTDRTVNPSDLIVLIVDDDPIAREHAKLSLENSGVSAEVASSGQEAIEMVTLRHARRNPYNLILMDWQMPEMDGVEASRRIRSIIGQESAIIILTAYKWDDITEEALSAGVDSFISKPLFAGNVLDEYQSSLDKRLSSETVHWEKATLAGKRVLLAEDIQINAEILIMTLEMMQITAEHASNGKIAVELFEKHPVGYYDAILMDMRMPEMDGLEATRQIRAMDRDDAKTIPIIALTANAFDEDVQRSLQAGLNAHLTKPVQQEVLFDTLQSLIQR